MACSVGSTHCFVVKDSETGMTLEGMKSGLCPAIRHIYQSFFPETHQHIFPFPYGTFPFFWIIGRSTVF
jgi:hypothetical protein